MMAGMNLDYKTPDEAISYYSGASIFVSAYTLPFLPTMCHCALRAGSNKTMDMELC